MITTTVPYSSELQLEYGQVLILCPQSAGLLNDRQYDRFAEEYARKGYELLYLPRIVRGLDEDLLAYYFPEKGITVSAELFQNRIASEQGIVLDFPVALIQKDECSLIRSNEGDETMEDFLALLLEQLEDISDFYCACGDVLASPCGMYEEDECTTYSSLPCPDSFDEPIGEEYDIEQLIDELKEVNEAKLRDLGLSESALRFLMGHVVPKLSRMTITRHAKIILEDYAGREIKMDHKTKALYFLYLRHPEGLSIKDLTDHTKELMDLYQSISGRDDPEAMKQTIENLCDPFQNNANISLSRIKKAFVEAFSPELAKTYYVDGERGGLRSISLSRELVTWETIR